MRATLRGFLREDRGEDLIEYGLLAAFIAAIATLVIVSDSLGLKPALMAGYRRAIDALMNS